MTITLELQPEDEAKLVAQANAHGLSLDNFLKIIIAAQAGKIGTREGWNAPKDQKAFSAQEIDRFFDEAADMIPAGVPPLSDDAMSRESIYTREDEW